MKAFGFGVCFDVKACTSEARSSMLENWDETDFNGSKKQEKKK